MQLSKSIASHSRDRLLYWMMLDRLLIAVLHERKDGSPMWMGALALFIDASEFTLLAEITNTTYAKTFRDSKLMLRGVS